MRPVTGLANSRKSVGKVLCDRFHMPRRQIAAFGGAVRRYFGKQTGMREFRLLKYLRKMAHRTKVNEWLHQKTFDRNGRIWYTKG